MDRARVWARIAGFFFIIAGIFSVGFFARAGSFPSIVVVTVVPNAPSSLGATAISQNEIDLAWTDTSNNENNFSIERSTGNNTGYAVIATTSANVATYADTGLTANTLYYYRVLAENSDGASGYSNEASATTQSAPLPPPGNGGGGGGGGGGGSGYYPPPSAPTTNVTITGSAYPLSKVFILQNGQLALQTVAGPDANFTASLTNLAGGNYNFSVYGEDGTGLRSNTFTFPVTVTRGATTLISGVFLSPTLNVDKDEVKKGDTIVIFGRTVPNAPVKIQVNSDQTIFLAATSSANGAYLYDFDTAALDYGAHSALSKAVQGNLISNDSLSRAFMVGDRNIAAATTPNCPPSGDLNGDCHVNLVDFSIMAFWYGRANVPARIDLNGDGVITLVDFSIMAYYWTG